jgi:peptidoglycan hydrolase-like protein with peptidoglycan-binding domain
MNQKGFVNISLIIVIFIFSAWVSATSVSAATAYYDFTRNLTVGSRGDDVKALQQFLNSQVATQIAASGPGSPNNETTYFGQLTRAALVKWQAANNIYPTAGYFGPLTRAKFKELYGNAGNQQSGNFTQLYPPTPSSFGCNPYAGTYETQQGKGVQTYDQWKVLYDELLKNCYTKTNAPQIIDFDKQTMIVVFGGRSCTATNVEVKTVSTANNKLAVRSVITAGGCSLPSFSFPFTLIAVDKSNLPIEFIFEPAKNPNEPF